MVLHRQHCILGVLQDVTQQRLADGDVITALESVMQDATWFGRAVVERLVQVRRQNGAARPGSEQAELSAREHEVLGLMCEGLGNAEIAARLALSGNTVRNHVSSIYGKIGVRNRGGAIVWARERGIGIQDARASGARRDRRKPRGGRRRTDASG
jgi:DNA-binding NarL/FixJ family response regulator